MFGRHGSSTPPTPGCPGGSSGGAEELGFGGHGSGPRAPRWWRCCHVSRRPSRGLAFVRSHRSGCGRGLVRVVLGRERARGFRGSGGGGVDRGSLSPRFVSASAL